MSLRHYVAMDRNPEQGCMIQNSSDGMRGIITQLKLVQPAHMALAVGKAARVAVAEAD